MGLEWDIEELACAACGLDEEEAGYVIDGCGVDDLLFGKYEVGFDTYYKIVKDLLKFTPIVESAIQGKKYHAFCRGDEMIVKVEAD